MRDKTKKGADAMNIGSTNPIDYLTGNQRLFTSDYAEKQGELQSNLLAVMKPAKIIRLYHCFGCERRLGAHRMSNCLAICKECYATAQDKGKAARNKFVEKTLNSIQRFLRRRVAL